MRIFSSFLIISFCLIASACKTPTKLGSVTDINFEGLKLNKKWESPEKFRIPECVIYDSNKDLLYISNVDGKPTNLDGEGFISRLSLNGTIVTLDWVDGLNAPKGMAIDNNKLYVSDINELVEIDIKAAEITNRYPAEGAEFLNDIAIVNGNVFVSDMATSRIYTLKNDQMEVWLEDEKLTRVNGLLAEGTDLLAGSNGHIYKINTKSKNMEEFISGTGPVDGLAAYGGGNYIFSDWTSKTFIAAPGKTPHLLLDTAEDYANSADLFYLPSRKTLYIPTFGTNTVVSYLIETK